MIFSDNHKPAKQRLVPFELSSDYMITPSCLLSENKTHTHTHTHTQSVRMLFLCLSSSTSAMSQLF